MTPLEAKTAKFALPKFIVRYAAYSAVSFMRSPLVLPTHWKKQCTLTRPKNFCDIIQKGLLIGQYYSLSRTNDPRAGGYAGGRPGGDEMR